LPIYFSEGFEGIDEQNSNSYENKVERKISLTVKVQDKHGDSKYKKIKTMNMQCKYQMLYIHSFGADIDQFE
jgi:hypothetical protein